METDRRTIESILNETRTFAPTAKTQEKATLRTDRMLALQEAADKDYVAFWADLARRHLTWHKPFTETLDESDAPNFHWFADGEINVCFNCIDRHLPTLADKTAIRWEGEPGDTRTLTYGQLYDETCRLANGLRSMGIEKGDRVAIYLPMVPEAAIAMLACARIGAPHSVVFGGFSATALKDRIEDTGARLLITADGGHRNNRIIELKNTADEALSMGCRTIEHVIVLRRTENRVAWNEKRDHWWHDLVNSQPRACDPEWVESEHPLFLLYTSGSTGKPKGIQHSSGGYLLGAYVTNAWCMDVHDSDVFWCTADVGWVTGHTYVVYGPLSMGTTILMYEGAPTIPDAGRFWKICQDHSVSIFYTAPTAIRALMKMGEQYPNSYDLDDLRILGTVGEPINPEAWMWYHRVIGKTQLPIVDTWWQTETGAAMIAPLPGVTLTKPGSCTTPLPGIAADVFDEAGHSVTDPLQGGYLVITKPWPHMLRTIWRDNPRYKETYFGRFGNHVYVAGDSAHRDRDGYFWIMGRIDDVLNVSGHRLGTMEIESALVSHPKVAEAAVVGRPDEITGEAIVAYVICRGERPTGKDAEELTNELRIHVTKEIGALARPREIRFASNLPKTRSGKIMRRLLRAIAKGESIAQDVSTLENPQIVDQLAGLS